MRKFLFYSVPLLVTVVLVAWLADPFAESGNIQAESAGEHLGHVKTVCGKVESSYYARDERGQPTFLNLDGEYPDHLVTVVIWGEDHAKFTRPEILYQERRICVTGTIGMYRDKPQIAVSDPEQIQVVKSPAWKDVWPVVLGTIVSGVLQFLLQAWLKGMSVPKQPEKSLGQGAAGPSPRTWLSALGSTWRSSWRTLLAIGLAGGMLAWLTTWLLRLGAA